MLEFRIVVFRAFAEKDVEFDVNTPVEDLSKTNATTEFTIDTDPAPLIVDAVVDAPEFVILENLIDKTPAPELANSAIPVVPISPLQLTQFTFDDA